MVGLQRKWSEIRLGYLKLWFNVNKLQDKFLKNIPQVLARIYFILCTVFGTVSFSSVQLCSRVLRFATPWTATRQASLPVTNSWDLIKFMSIESVMPSNHLILCRPLLLPPSIFPSVRVFYNESILHIRWPEYLSFSFSISPSNEYLGLIFFWMDWLDLLAVQETLKSLLQHHNSKPSILQCSAFFMVQLSHPYIATRFKNHSFD